jgi:hypothetical protein
MTAPYPTELERRLRIAYASQRRNAAKRGIPFRFSFEEWSEWWLTDDRWSRRGRKAGLLQMGRKGNSGPLAPDNVELTTKEQKQRSQLIAALAKPVMTPLGTFPTVTAAAKATRHSAALRFSLGQGEAQRLALSGPGQAERLRPSRRSMSRQLMIKTSLPACDVAMKPAGYDASKR